ncbi:adipocyte plasma membrane-associated protein, partial [Biomphalaria glabrata]
LSLKPGRTWLQLSNFADNLPGLPDNIRSSGRNTYWVAMSQARHANMTSMVDEYANQPQMREMIAN